MIDSKFCVAIKLLYPEHVLLMCKVATLLGRPELTPLCV